MKPKTSIRDLCFTALFTAIIAVSAYISIPMPLGVPMTLQTLAIPLAGIVLGAKYGTMATVVYVLLGAVGLPIFAGFRGGISVIFGRTGGFILSFPLMALAAGIGERMRRGKLGMLWLTSGLVAGAAVNYLFGMFFFALIAPSSIWTAFTGCVLPFIPTAILKIILAAALGRTLKSRLMSRLVNRVRVL